MLTLRLNNITMEHGSRKLFEIKSLQVYTNDKIGIVGANGSGKTTLLDIIAGKTKPTSGKAELLADFAYIEQLDDLEEKDREQLSYSWSVPDDPRSGGEVMRLKISKALAERAQMLICDEPTTNLDEQGIEKLEKSLRGHRGTLLLVSHDRKLLDAVCNKIWEIDGELTEYSGGYSDFAEEKEKRRKNEQKEYDKYTSTKKRLEEAVKDRSRKAGKMKKPPKRMGNSEARLHRMEVRQRAGKISKASGQIKSRLEKLDVKQKPKELPSFKINSAGGFEKTGKVAVRVEDLGFSYGAEPVLSDFSMTVLTGEKVALTGSNGSGKTTLIECIANGCEGVKVSPSSEIGYFHQNCADLNEESSLIDYVMSTSKQPEHAARAVIARLGIRRDDVYKKIGVLSGGERCKAVLSKLICQNPSILLLDEPTNYLDIYVMIALEEMLLGFEGTLLLVTHDRYFREKIAQREINLDKI